MNAALCSVAVIFATWASAAIAEHLQSTLLVASPDVVTDDSCPADGSGGQCALHALQMQGSKKKKRDLNEDELFPWLNPSFKGKVWESSSQTGLFPWPEQTPSFLAKTPNRGVSIGGGGTRSYAAGFGQLRGLHLLDQLNTTRYLSSISGGAWVTTIYVYQSRFSEDVLLAEPYKPSNLSMKNLGILPESSLGYGATQDFVLPIVTGFLGYLFPFFGNGDPSLIWNKAFGESMLSHYGLNTDQFFTLDTLSLNAILKANPTLKAKDFVLPNAENKPFHIIGLSAGGPMKNSKCLNLPTQHATNISCLDPVHESYRNIEVTPLYTGYPLTQEVKVKYGDDTYKQITTGGLKESFLFNTKSPAGRVDITGSPGTELNVEVTQPTLHWTLRDAAGGSSAWGSRDQYWVEVGPREGPGNSVNTPEQLVNTLTQPILNPFARLCDLVPFWLGGGVCSAFFQVLPSNWYNGLLVTGQFVEQWNVAQINPVTQNVFIADGGIEGDDSGIDDLLLHGVMGPGSQQVSFINSITPLCNASTWNPAKDQDQASVFACVDWTLALMFGICDGKPGSWGPDGKTYDPARIQVFESSEFAPFMISLQESKAAGKTAVTKSSLTTVANSFLGLEAGQKVNMLLFYLSSSPTWEAMLPQDTRDELHKPDGQFAHFPHFRTGQKGPLTALSAEQVNLLASLTTWAVTENHDLFDA